MSIKVQLRRDTKANWTSVNPILSQGEMGFETDTSKFKIGDGSTAWISLSYTEDADFYKYSIVRSVSNLIVNNSFETDLTSWSVYDGAATNTRVTSQFYNGTASMQITTTGPSQGTVITQTTITGETYTVSFYAKGNVGGENLNIYTGTSSNYTLTNGWVRYTHTFVATGTSSPIYIRNMSGVTTTFFIDAVQLEQGRTDATTFTTTQGNITVALKNYEGNDPTPTKPVKIQIGGVIMTITSALSFTRNAGNNILNIGSAELATKEVDLFVYVFYYSNAGSGAKMAIGYSRKPNGDTIADFNLDATVENGIDYPYDTNVPTSTIKVANIGRFNATLSAGGAYTWSIPATSVIINSKILENQKQKNQLIVGEGINQSASYTTSVTMDFSSFIEYDITAQAGALLFNNPSGTPVNGQKRMVRIKDNGTARALTYGTQFASGSGTLLPTTVISKKSWMGFEWDSTDSKYYCIASCTQP